MSTTFKLAVVAAATVAVLSNTTEACKPAHLCDLHPLERAQRRLEEMENNNVIASFEEDPWDSRGTWFQPVQTLPIQLKPRAFADEDDAEQGIAQDVYNEWCSYRSKHKQTQELLQKCHVAVMQARCENPDFTGKTADWEERCAFYMNIPEPSFP